jgi:hypothetical protein
VYVDDDLIDQMDKDSQEESDFQTIGESDINNDQQEQYEDGDIIMGEIL